MRNFASPSDYRAAMRVVRALERPGEPILVFAPEDTLPMGYYYRGPNRLATAPRAIVPQGWRSPYTPAEEAAARDSMRRLTGSTGEFWLLFRPVWPKERVPARFDLDLPCRGRVLVDTSFPGAHGLRLLRLALPEDPAGPRDAGARPRTCR